MSKNGVVTEKVQGGTVTYIRECKCQKPPSSQYPDGAVFTCNECGASFVNKFDFGSYCGGSYWCKR